MKKQAKILFAGFIIIAFLAYYSKIQTIREGYGLSQFTRDSKALTNWMEKVKDFVKVAF
jgi:hypothetical protein